MIEKEPVLDIEVIHCLIELSFRNNYSFSYYLNDVFEQIEMSDLYEERGSIYISVIDEDDFMVSKPDCNLKKERVSKQSEIIDIVIEFLEK